MFASCSPIRRARPCTDYFAYGELKAEGSTITEGIGQGRVTGNVDGAPVDDQYRISDAEAVETIFELAEHEGHVLGASSGVNVAGAVRVARDMGAGACDRHHAVRLRPPLSEQAVQSGVS